MRSCPKPGGPNATPAGLSYGWRSGSTALNHTRVSSNGPLILQIEPDAREIVHVVRDPESRNTVRVFVVRVDPGVVREQELAPNSGAKGLVVAYASVVRIIEADIGLDMQP